MPLSLTQMRPINPSIEHASIAAARVPFVGSGDVATLQQAATSLGFNPVGQDQYQHPVDKSWIAMNVNGRVERGVGNDMFASRPMDLAALPMAAPGAFGAVAAQTIDPSLSSMRVTAELTRQGFTQVLPTYFVHADQSWVALVQDLGVVRGVGQQQMDPTDVMQRGSSRAARRSSSANDTTSPQHTKAMNPDTVLSFPSVSPAFEDGFLACAQPGFLQHDNRASDAGSLQQLGFKESTPGLFEHVDGSFIAYTSQGTIERGCGQQLFAGVPISPARLGQIPPNATYLGMALAEPTLATLTAKQVLDGVKPLKDAGFKQTRPGFWQHQDTSFVAAVGGQVVFGANNQVLSTHPASMPQIQSQPAHGFYAIAKTGTLSPTDTQLAQKLGDLGFYNVSTGVYQHDDGSWIAVQAGAFLRGVGSDVLKDVPKPPKPGEYQTYTTLPGGDWSQWQRQFAIAKLPLIYNNFTNSEVQKIMTHLGFVGVGNGQWQHPDGSAVSLYMGGSHPTFLSSRFQQWDFSHFPYQNGTDSNGLSILTQQWLAWVQTGSNPPF